jgi:hypothetical protein
MGVPTSEVGYTSATTGREGRGEAALKKKSLLSMLKTVQANSVIYIGC